MEMLIWEGRIKKPRGVVGQQVVTNPAEADFSVLNTSFCWKKILENGGNLIAMRTILVKANEARTVLHMCVQEGEKNLGKTSGNAGPNERNATGTFLN